MKRLGCWGLYQHILPLNSMCCRIFTDRILDSSISASFVHSHHPSCFCAICVLWFPLLTVMGIKTRQEKSHVKMQFSIETGAFPRDGSYRSGPPMTTPCHEAALQWWAADLQAWAAEPKHSAALWMQRTRGQVLCNMLMLLLSHIHLRLVDHTEIRLFASLWLYTCRSLILIDLTKNLHMIVPFILQK